MDAKDRGNTSAEYVLNAWWRVTPLNFMRYSFFPLTWRAAMMRSYSLFALPECGGPDSWLDLLPEARPCLLPLREVGGVEPPADEVPRLPLPVPSPVPSSESSSMTTFRCFRAGDLPACTRYQAIFWHSKLVAIRCQQCMECYEITYRLSLYTMWHSQILHMRHDTCDSFPAVET